MQLVESVPRDLPVVLLIEVPKGHRVGQNLVQALDALLANLLAQSVRQFGDSSERLDFGRSLADFGPGSLRMVLERCRRIAVACFCFGFCVHKSCLISCSSSADLSTSYSGAPSYLASLIKKQGVPFTPLRMPLARSSLIRLRIPPCSRAAPNSSRSSPT